MNPDIAGQYKKNLRRQIAIVVLVMFGFYAINLASEVIVMLASTALSTFSQVFAQMASGGAVPDASELADNITSGMPWLTGLMSIVGIIAGACIMFVLRGKKLVTSDLTQVNERINVSVFFMIILLAFGVQALITIVEIPLAMITEAMGGSLTGEYSDSINQLINPMGILYIVLIGPIFEEIMFRGAVMRSLERFGVNFAIVISSLIFGLYHIFLYQAAFAFLLGLLLAYVAHRFSLKWAILLHILNNSFSMLLTLIPAEENAQIIMGLLLFGFYILSLAGSIVLLVVQRKAIAAQLARQKPASMLYVLGLPMQTFAPPPPAPDSQVYPEQYAPAPPPASPYPEQYAPASPPPPMPAYQVYPTQYVLVPPQPQMAQQVAYTAPLPDVIPPLAQAYEPQPHPYKITFTSPLLIFAMAVVLFFSLTMIFPILP